MIGELEEIFEENMITHFDTKNVSFDDALYFLSKYFVEFYMEGVMMSTRYSKHIKDVPYAIFTSKNHCFSVIARIFFRLKDVTLEYLSTTKNCSEIISAGTPFMIEFSKFGVDGTEKQICNYYEKTL